VGAFDHWKGQPTVARLFSAPGQVITGWFDPALPQFPLQSATQPTRWGFREFFNGYVFGPEGTSRELLQAAVDAGKLADIGPNGFLGVKPGMVITALDFEDSRYLRAPDGSSVYEQYAFTRQASPGDPPPPPPDPPSPPVVTPPVQPPDPPWSAAYTAMRAALPFDPVGTVDLALRSLAAAGFRRTSDQPPASSGLHPLSPATVRAEELRRMVSISGFFGLPIGQPFASISWEGLAKPLAVEALRVWRRLRAKLGDARVIPQEDR
jgi:hypothetical protein